MKNNILFLYTNFLFSSSTNTEKKEDICKFFYQYKKNPTNKIRFLSLHYLPSMWSLKTNLHIKYTFVTKKPRQRDIYP